MTVAIPSVKRTRDGAKFALGLWTWLVVLFLMIPIFFVVLHSFNGGNSFNIWKEWGGGRWYKRIIDDKPFRDTLINSFKAAFGSTVISLIIGALAGVAVSRRRGKWTGPFLGILFLILVTPEIIDAVALLGWFNQVPGVKNIFQNGLLGIRGGMLSLWVGHSLFSSAVVTLIVRARLEGLDESLEEAAADLGAPPGRAFRQITLPLMSPALVAGGMLSLSFSLDNTIMSSFIAGDSSTYPVYLLGTVKSTPRPSIAAGAVVLFLTTLIAAAITISTLKRSGQSSSEIASNLAAG